MSSLFGNLSIAVKALMTQQAAIQTTSNNIANINTPGYTRQRAILQEDTPVIIGMLLFGTGASVEKVESIRDKVLEIRLHQETQQEGKLDAFLDAMKQVEGLFNEAVGVGLEGVLTAFFNSLLELSTNPSNIPLRQEVITAAENLTNSFRQAANRLYVLQSNLDRDVTQTVSEINTLTTEIAKMNAKVSGLESAGLESGAFKDRRTLLTRELSRLVDLAVIDAGGGSVTLTTTRGTALVVGDTSIPFQTQTDLATGFQLIFSQGSDITATIASGQLSGLLQARDQDIPSILADLDTLAADLSNAFNAVHTAGFDLAGAAGGNFFVPPPATGAAASFALAFTDPTLFAASSDGTVGSNGNVAVLADLRNQAIVSGQPPGDFYVNFVGRVGNKVAIASTQLEAEILILRQLKNQRSNISGVSLDEEAANLIRFQQAFQASARVVTVIDELTRIVVNLGRY